jgi:hypothetical protein
MNGEADLASNWVQLSSNYRMILFSIAAIGYLIAASQRTMHS